MKKLSNINEDILTDIIMRDRKGEVRKEDNISNANKLKGIDFGGSFLIADDDFCIENSEYLFNYEDAIENIQPIYSKYGWRIPSLEDIKEFADSVTIDINDGNYILTSKKNRNIIKFSPKGLKYFFAGGCLIDKGLYYCWTSTSCNDSNAYANVLIMDNTMNDIIYFTSNPNKKHTIFQSVKDKLCIRLIKDK